jgi:hypothetical protein
MKKEKGIQARIGKPIEAIEKEIERGAMKGQGFAIFGSLEEAQKAKALLMGAMQAKAKIRIFALGPREKGLYTMPRSLALSKGKAFSLYIEGEGKKGKEFLSFSNLLFWKAEAQKGREARQNFQAMKAKLEEAEKALFLSKKWKLEAEAEASQAEEENESLKASLYRAEEALEILPKAEAKLREFLSEYALLNRPKGSLEGMGLEALVLEAEAEADQANASLACFEARYDELEAEAEKMEEGKAKLAEENKLLKALLGFYIAQK